MRVGLRAAQRQPTLLPRRAWLPEMDSHLRGNDSYVGWGEQREAQQIKPSTPKAVGLRYAQRQPTAKPMSFSETYVKEEMVNHINAVCSGRVGWERMDYRI